MVEGGGTSNTATLYYPNWYVDVEQNSDTVRKGVIMFVLTTVRFSTYHLRASSCSYTFFFLDDIRPLGEAPAYITQAASAFMFEDLEDCCEKYYWWNMAECLGSAANAGSNKYYADYSQSKCVKDCTDSDCGGLVGGVWDELYDDKALCCAEKFWWVEDCNA
eukprot:scaffold7416_cov136-Alexandrium_tamarense.AAC.2